MSKKPEKENEKFRVKYEYVPSKDAKERLIRAFRMIFFKDGELAPEFEELCKKRKENPSSKP